MAAPDIPDWSAQKITATRRGLLTWYDLHKKTWPWRKNHHPFRVWTSEIMLQQTVLKAVVPVYQRFHKNFPTVLALAQASEEEVKQACAGLGYYRRFRLMHRAAQQLCAESADRIRWPKGFDQWQKLPGIGTYTAAAIASIVDHDRVGVVDGNVERVFCRWFDLRKPANDPQLKKSFFAFSQHLVAPSRPGDFNQALMELGQTLCRKQEPQCPQCPVKRGCLSFQRGSQHLAPAEKIKAAKIPLSLNISIPLKGKGTQRYIGLSPRSDSRFLKGTLGFPNHETTALTGPLDFKHSITNHQISAQVHLIRRPSGEISWIPVKEIDDHLVTSLDRKAWTTAKAMLQSPASKV